MSNAQFAWLAVTGKRGSENYSWSHSIDAGISSVSTAYLNMQKGLATNALNAEKSFGLWPGKHIPCKCHRKSISGKQCGSVKRSSACQITDLCSQRGKVTLAISVWAKEVNHNQLYSTSILCFFMAGMEITHPKIISHGLNGSLQFHVPISTPNLSSGFMGSNWTRNSYRCLIGSLITPAVSIVCLSNCPIK